MSISALIIDDEQLAREELKYLLDSVGDVDVVAQGSNGIDAIELIDEYHPDLVFLDVQMPGQDGFAVIQRLLDRAKDRANDRVKDRANSAGEIGAETSAAPLPQFVFATAYDQYAVRAFNVNAVDYLLKPFDLARVSEAVDRAKARIAAGSPSAGAAPYAGIESPGIESQLHRLLSLLNRPQNSEQGRAPAKLIVQAQSRLLLVDQADICFASIDEGVIRIVTRVFEGQSKCRTLEELLELLDSTRFWRAHRGFVVNIDQIREVMPWFKSSYQLRMNDKQQTEIPVSRAQTKRLRELFNL
jgi:two-component system LytT family response regulator/two-component system response regulator LytT